MLITVDELLDATPSGLYRLAVWLGVPRADKLLLPALARETHARMALLRGAPAGTVPAVVIETDVRPS